MSGIIRPASATVATWLVRATRVDAVLHHLLAVPWLVCCTCFAGFRTDPSWPTPGSNMSLQGWEAMLKGFSLNLAVVAKRNTALLLG